jgi:hypothetical protein
MVTIWAIVGIVAPAVLGLGLSFLGFTPPDFRNARRLTWISFAILTGWTITWLFLTYADIRIQIYTVIGIGVANVIGLTCAMIFIGHRERLYQPSAESSGRADVQPQAGEDTSGPRAAKIPARLKVSIKFFSAEDVPKTVAIIIRNTGGSEALHLHLADIHVFQQTVRFPDEIASLSPGDATRPLKPVVIEYPKSQAHDMPKAMYEAACTGSGSPRNDRFDYQGEATFYDSDGKKFRALWRYTFFPIRYRRSKMQKDPSFCAEDGEETGPFLTVSDVGIEKIDF